MKKTGIFMLVVSGLIIAAAVFVYSQHNLIKGGNSAGEQIQAKAAEPIESEPIVTKIGEQGNQSSISVKSEQGDRSIVSENNEKVNQSNQDNTDVKTEENKVSGPIANVPWENDESFKKRQAEVGANVLMAAYQTVLRDPLPGEEYNVHLAARMLAGKVINPGAIFSQNQSVGPYTIEKGFQKGPTYMGARLVTTIGGGVCKIASTLYNVSILSNLEIVERHPHSMPVPYVPYGQDATVSYGARDIRFRNNTSSPIMIWALGVDNVLYMGFYGKEKPPEIKWQHETLNVQKAPVIYQKNQSLPSGTEKVIIEGMDGVTVRSHITIINPDGSSSVKNLGISYYKPMPYVVEINK